MVPANRRAFLKTTGAAAALAGLGDLAFLSALRPVSAAEATLDADVVRFDSGIEPIVRLLEETPRENIVGVVADRVKRGLSYREVLAAVQLAAIRNVQPRPSVGHKFHSVLVVNAAHLASLASPAEHRWLPIFWAVDYFKSSQAQDVRENNWTMPPVDEKAIPSATKARDEFVSAMESWDEGKADAAAAALARTAGTNGIYELFYRLGMRDFRSIGHKAIYVANSRRTLECIGRQHTEPVVRSLAYALLMHEGGNPAERDDAADRPFRRNQELAGKIRTDWLGGKLDDKATREVLVALRTESNDALCDMTVELLNRGVSPQSIWDGLLVGSGELLMKQPGIVALHSVTTSNAAKYAFDAAADDQTRRMILLQTAAFVPMFREALGGRGSVAEVTVDDLATDAKPDASDEAIGNIFAAIDTEPIEAARRTLAYLKSGRRAEDVIDAARTLVFLKSDDAHDYKFSSAVLEDYYNVSPQWRDLYLASNVLKLQSSTRPDNGLVERTRSALA